MCIRDREKTEAESSEERREKSEKAIGENAENSRSDQSEACGEEKSGRVIIHPLQTEEGELSVGRASVALPAKRKQRVH